MTGSTISNHWGVAAPSRYFHKPSVNHLFNHLINDKAVYRADLAALGLFKMLATLATHWLDICLLVMNSNILISTSFAAC